MHTELDVIDALSGPREETVRDRGRVKRQTRILGFVIGDLNADEYRDRRCPSFTGADVDEARALGSKDRAWEDEIGRASCRERV